MGKILLTNPKNVILKLDDCVLEVSRFDKKEYTLYQIKKIFEDGGCELLVLKSTIGFKQGRTVTGVIDCFYGGRNCKWLNYYLPAGQVLYGEST